MTTRTRVSNEQILAALTAINATLQTLSGSTTAARPAPIQTIEPVTVQEQERAAPSSIQVDAKYKAVMLGKAQEKANTDRIGYVLYARFNGAGQLKLAYVSKSKYLAGVNDRGHIGALAEVAPQ